MTTLKQRFALLSKEKPDITQADLARATGAKPPSVNAWFSGETKSMKGSTAAKAAALYQCSALWLSDGVGEIWTQVHQATSIQPSSSFGTPAATQSEPHDIVIPQYAAGGAMGNGLVLEEKQPGIIKSWNVDQEWLRLNVKGYTSLKNLCIVTGFGPSMRPLYNPGDPLLLDCGVSVVDSEGVFFFRIGDHGYIKQLQRIPVGRETVIRAKSLNPSYDPFDITPDMDFQVFGKVLTIWKSEQV